MAVEVLVRAFWEYPEALHLLPDAGVRTRVLRRFMSSVLRDAAKYGEVETTQQEGVVTGIALWYPGGPRYPGGPSMSARRQLAHAARLLPVIAIAPAAVPEVVRAQIELRRHTIQAPNRLLAFLAVDPGSRTRGIGSALLGAGLRRADDQRTPVVLSTSDSTNVAWYEGFGFKVVAELRLTPTWPTVWQLRRALPEPSGPHAAPLTPTRAPTP